MKFAVAMLSVLSLAACSPSYKDLEKAFPSTTRSTSPPLKTRTIVLTSQKHRGAESYNDLVTIRLSSSSIELDNAAPFRSPVSVPVDEVTGCSMTCFGWEDQHVDLLIAKTGTDLMIPRSDALLEWCWSTRRPMVPGKSLREWQYQNVPLPGPEAYHEQLQSREAYDAQAKQSCLGY